MNLEADTYLVCRILRHVQSKRTERHSDESFAMNLAVMALMFAATYHGDEFRQYWKFVTTESFPHSRLSEIASKVAALEGKEEQEPDDK